MQNSLFRKVEVNRKTGFPHVNVIIYSINILYLISIAELGHFVRVVEWLKGEKEKNELKQTKITQNNNFNIT